LLKILRGTNELHEAEFLRRCVAWPVRKRSRL